MSTRAALDAFKAAYAAYCALPAAEQTDEARAKLVALKQASAAEERAVLLAKPGYRARYAPRGHLHTERRR